jgi:hypothetical protein
MLAVIGDALRPDRIDDDRAVKAFLLLQTGMAVIPVGARLGDRELVDKGRARRNAGEGDSRHAVHRGGHQQPMPVYRAVLVEIVAHGQAQLLPPAKSKQWRGHGAIDADSMALPPVDRHHLPSDRQRYLFSRKGWEQLDPCAPRPRPGRQPRVQLQPRACERASAQQRPAIEGQGRLHHHYVHSCESQLMLRLDTMSGSRPGDEQEPS